MAIGECMKWRSKLAYPANVEHDVPPDIREILDIAEELMTESPSDRYVYMARLMEVAQALGEPKYPMTTIIANAL